MFEEEGYNLVLCCFQTNKKQGASPQMQSTPRERLLQFSHVLQTVLFERLELELGPLSEKRVCWWRC